LADDMQLRHRHEDREARNMSQGEVVPGHAAVLAVLLRERPTCLDCTAAALGLSVSHVNQYLIVIGAALPLVRLDDEHCRCCGEIRSVFSIRSSPKLITETYETYVSWTPTAR